eukprot:12421285-Karenia_brevis.AAC.1
MIPPLFGGGPKVEEAESTGGEAATPAGVAQPEGVDSQSSFSPPKGKGGGKGKGKGKPKIGKGGKNGKGKTKGKGKSGYGKSRASNDDG